MFWTILIFWAQFAGAAGCPGADDEPALSVKTKAGPTLILCGFEDHEIQRDQGRRAFSEFHAYAVTSDDKPPTPVFASEGGDTHWASTTAEGGLRLEELWIFADKPHPAIARTITCDTAQCKVERATCVLNLKKNVFPKALPTLQRRLKSKKPVGEDGEDLLDEVWAQALTGDPGAAAFYDQPVPPALDATLADVFAGNLAKLKLARELKCKDVR